MRRVFNIIIHMRIIPDCLSVALENASALGPGVCMVTIHIVTLSDAKFSPLSHYVLLALTHSYTTSHYSLSLPLDDPSSLLPCDTEQCMPVDHLLTDRIDPRAAIRRRQHGHKLAIHGLCQEGFDLI